MRFVTWGQFRHISRESVWCDFPVENFGEIKRTEFLRTRDSRSSLTDGEEGL